VTKWRVGWKNGVERFDISTLSSTTKTMDMKLNRELGEKN
jgi:hypothetical protein